jgi:hypothetical protein
MIWLPPLAPTPSWRGCRVEPMLAQAARAHKAASQYHTSPTAMGWIQPKLLEWDEPSIEKSWQVWEGALNNDRYEAKHCSQGLFTN